MTATRCSWLVALAALVVLAGMLPLLRANAAARQQAWQQRCLARGGQVFSQPSRAANPLVVQTGHPVLSCVSAAGVVVSVRD